MSWGCSWAAKVVDSTAYLGNARLVAGLLLLMRNEHGLLTNGWPWGRRIATSRATAAEQLRHLQDIVMVPLCAGCEQAAVGEVMDRLFTAQASSKVRLDSASACARPPSACASNGKPFHAARFVFGTYSRITYAYAYHVCMYAYHSLAYLHCDLCRRSYISGRDRVCQQRLANKRGLFTKGRQSSRHNKAPGCGIYFEGSGGAADNKRTRRIVCMTVSHPMALKGTRTNSWRGRQQC